MLVYPVPNAENAKNAIFDCLDWLPWSSAIAQSENLPGNCRDLHSLVVPFSLVDEQGAGSSMFHKHIFDDGKCHLVPTQTNFSQLQTSSWRNPGI